MAVGNKAADTDVSIRGDMSQTAADKVVVIREWRLLANDILQGLTVAVTRGALVILAWQSPELVEVIVPFLTR